MRDLTFRGQVQRKGFDPIKVPSEVWKIQKETDDVLRNMERTAAQELKNRNEYAQSLKETQALEASLREDRFDLTTEFAEAYRDAEMQHYKTRLADYSEGGAYHLEHKLREKGRAARGSTMQQLASLSKTALGYLNTANEQRGRQLVAYGTEIATRWGLTPEELKLLQFQSQNIDFNDAALNRVKKRLTDAGASPEELNSILGLSGRALLGAQEYAMGVAGVQAYPAFFNEMRLTPIKEANGLSWADIEQDPNGIYSSEARVILRNINARFLEKFKGIGESGTGYDNAFLAAHLRPHMQKHDEQLLIQQADRDKKAYVRRENKVFDDKLLGKIYGWGGKNVGKGIEDHIKITAGFDPKEMGKARRRTFNTLNRLAEDGRFTLAMYEDLENHQFQLGDKGPLRYWGDVYYNEMQTLKAAVDKRVKAEWTAKDNAEKEFDMTMRRSVERSFHETGRAPTEFDLKKVSEQYLAQSYQVPEWVTNYRTREMVRDQDGNAELTAMYNNSSSGIPSIALYSGRYSKELIKAWKDKTNEKLGINTKEVTTYEKVIKGAVAKKYHGQVLGDDQWDPDVHMMSADTMTIWRKRVKEAFKTGVYGTDAATIYSKVTGELQEEILADKEGSYWDLNRKNGEVIRAAAQGAGWATYTDRDSYDKLGTKLRVQALEDPTVIDRPGFIPAEVHTKVENMVAGEEMPNIIQQIHAAYKHLSYDDIIDRLREADDLPVLKRPGARALSQCISPELSHLINHKPCLSKTRRAILQQSKKTDDEINGIHYVNKATSTHIKDVEQMGDKKLGAVRGVDGSSKPVSWEEGFGVWDKEMTVMGVREILSRRSAARLAWSNLDANDFEDAVNKGWTTWETPVTESLQNNIMFNKSIEATSVWTIPTPTGNEVLPANGQVGSGPPVSQLPPEIQSKYALLAEQGFNIGWFRFTDLAVV